MAWIKARLERFRWCSQLFPLIISHFAFMAQEAVSVCVCVCVEWGGGVRRWGGDLEKKFAETKH